MKIDSLIFDLDGTLWDSSEGIVATWALVLENFSLFICFFKLFCNVHFLLM